MPPLADRLTLDINSVGGDAGKFFLLLRSRDG